MTLTPSTIGGLPIIFLHNYAIRAESDLLSAFIDLTFFTQTFDPEIGVLLTGQFAFSVSTRDDIVGLLKDPYSLPISKPPLPKAALYKLVERTLGPSVRNEQARELFSQDSFAWTTDFVKCITSSPTIQPIILLVIYSCTPQAQKDELLRQFIASSSVI